MSNQSPSTHQTIRPRGRIRLSYRILIGLGLGIATGLMFGELCQFFNLLANAFVGLLQMTVLPYIALALVANVGRLTPEQAKRLTGRAGIFF